MNRRRLTWCGSAQKSINYKSEPQCSVQKGSGASTLPTDALGWFFFFVFFFFFFYISSMLLRCEYKMMEWCDVLDLVHFLSCCSGKRRMSSRYPVLTIHGMSYHYVSLSSFLIFHSVAVLYVPLLRLTAKKAEIQIYFVWNVMQCYTLAILLNYLIALHTIFKLFFKSLLLCLHTVRQGVAYSYFKFAVTLCTTLMAD